MRLKQDEKAKAIEFYLHFQKVGLTPEMRDYLMQDENLAALVVQFLDLQLTTKAKLMLDLARERQERDIWLQANLNMPKSWPSRHQQLKNVSDWTKGMRQTYPKAMLQRADAVKLPEFSTQTADGTWVLVPNDCRLLIAQALMRHGYGPVHIQHYLKDLPLMRPARQSVLRWECIVPNTLQRTAPADVADSAKSPPAGLGILAMLAHSAHSVLMNMKQEPVFNLGGIECHESGERGWPSVLSLHLNPKQFSFDFGFCSKTRASRRRYNPIILDAIEIY